MMNVSRALRCLLATAFLTFVTIASAQQPGGIFDGRKPITDDQAFNPGVNPLIAISLARSGFPRLHIEFGNGDYFADENLFTGSSNELSIQVTATDPQTTILNASLVFNAFVDEDGNLIGGVGGDDLVVSGDVDVDGDGIVDVSGVILTGEVTSYSAINGTGGNLDLFMLSFSTSGGLLANDFGRTVNLTIAPNISGFSGNYNNDFKFFYRDATLIGKGSVCTGTLGDYVWEDTNGNGIQDAGEEGIDGVTVTLTDANGDVSTVVTMTGGPNNAPGYYQFSMLCAGTYTIAVDLSTVPAGFIPTIIEGPGSTPENDSNDPGGSIVVLPEDDSSDQDTDFGFEPLLASLGDYVWNDTDMDGIQDPGENGVEGVTVNLLDCNGVQLASTFTDDFGFYEFTDLPPGCYQVEFEVPDGFEVSPQFNGPSDMDSDANPFTGISDPVVLAPGEDNPTIDAGIFEPANSSLGDYVWNDTDMDGVQDPGEEGIENVIVTLLDCDGTVLDTTNTDNTGFYEFTNLVAGCYKVMFTLPDGYVFSPSFSGPADTDSNADPANGMSEMITLGVNEDNPTIDAGMFIPPTSSLGDFFWLDNNADGIQDIGEPGIEGVPVQLYNCNDELLDSTTTGPGGAYLFEDLEEGCYYVVFEPPADCVLSPQGAGGNPAADSNADPASGQTGNVNLGQGDSDLTIDAGCYFTAGLGDYVWNDEDQDGIQDPNENGIPGLLVELLDMNMNPTGMTTTTGPNGEYSFTDLMPGKYFVQFTAPNGYVFTTQGAGIDDTMDSNANGTGKTGIIMLGSGEFDPTIDAGVFLPQEPMIDIEKSTNGFDADDPTGPYIPVGGTVTWTYQVTNTGNVTLTNIIVTDSDLGVINCPFTQLDSMESDTCTATGTAVAGQYANDSDVIGTSPLGEDVIDDDPSHYFGSDPSIDIEKATNTEDADDPTGPLIPVGNPVNWTYVVMNTGNVTLTNVTVTDSDPSVTVTCPLTELVPAGGQGASTMTCTASGTATLGQYVNDSDVVGTPPAGPPVEDDDPSHYFGVDASITIEKSTNGVDADDPNAGDAPQIEPGDSITWIYLVTNTGNVTLTDVGVTDTQGVQVTCPMDTLLSMEYMECEGVGVAIDLSDPDAQGTVPGVCGITPGTPMYTNTGVAVGTTPTGSTVNADDPSHYCNPQVCEISVDATCLIPMPPASDYSCNKPIDTLTFIWDGSQAVRIKAWKGSVGSTLLADIDDITPGEEISVSGFAGSPNDVFFEVFAAGSDNKLGESNFHLSCSDDDMDGPEDCGLPQGNGKDNDSDMINSWLLEGIVDEGGTLDCTAPDATGSDTCNFQSFPASCETIDDVDTLTLNYTGGSCADSQNSQDDKFDCEGSVDGSLPALVILDNGDSFYVDPGESFNVPNGKVSLSNAGGMMNLDIHTSCSAPLVTGDVYGATTLQLINNMGNGTDVIYSYTITNDGDFDIVDLMAEDIPLGPIPGLPSTLPSGESVTLFNTTFVDTTTQSNFIVDAVDSNGASCSAQDLTTVNILPPPPCDIEGEGVLDIDHDKIKWNLTNVGASTATVDTITITWPEDIHGFLKEIKFGGDKIYDTETTGGTLTLGPSDWIGDSSKRSIDPGDEETLELVFDGHNHGEYGADAYSITVTFEEGCSVTFENTGLPFECNKPISELTMIWDGAMEPIRVKAWKGDVGSELLLDQSDITAGTEVTVSGYAGSPNDVYWEIFSGNTKLGESNFHMSCSDSNMSGADDCGKRQGNGKSDSSMLINDWLLEGMVDNDGPFDCTP